MGRNIFRGKTICKFRNKLIFPLLLGLFSGLFLAFPGALIYPSPLSLDEAQADLISLLQPSAEAPRKALAVEQGHKGPAVFSLTVPSSRRIDFYLDKYSTGEGKAWLSRVLERGFLYRGYILNRLNEYKVPRELLFLPVVESAYNGRAVSRSGAVGLWQFMMNSISPYDLTVDKWVDDRRDFWKATEASIQKLVYNYSVLGDWLLALAAYNCGLGKMTRTIEKTGLRDFWALANGGHLPYETANYVPKFLAVAAIGSYSGRYGIHRAWRESVQWERIALDQAVDLRILSKESGAPYELLHAGNLELRYRVSPPGDHNYFLKVPSDYSDAVRETLEREDHRLMKFHIYDIRSGDTLYDLSVHYGITVGMIEEYNGGINPRALRIGQRVLVPLLKDSPPYQGKKRKEAAREYEATYIVQQGDTLWGIARNHGISPEELADQNLLTLDTVIHGGLKLRVPE